ncbi:restriction endonuclease subunit S [Aeromonas veronii]|uniref:restriction endonuclease subunit S n=1 Tax=Aeromonas veronii TaxID=654 RepID=UPI003F7A2F5F
MAEQIMQETADKAIPAGYKQTEVGIIPEDWVVYSVGDIIQRSQLGGNYENTENTSDYPLIKMGNLGRGYISLDKIEYVTSKPSSKDRLMFGDVLFNTRNTLELVGKVAVWRNELDEAYFNSNILRFYFDKDVVADSFFMNLAMNTSGFISQLSGIATGTTSVAAIYTRDLYTLKMAIPAKQEQTAIANVLSDSDALIDALEQLIAKKQSIKTAAMQQLLTGRTRLPQFALRPDDTLKGYKSSELGQIPEDWEVAPIGSVLSITTGARNTQDKVDDGRYPFFVRSQTIERINTYSFDGEAVLTAGDGVGTGKVFHYINGKFDFHQRVYLIYNFGERVSGYFFYLFFSNNFFDRIMSMTAKSSVDSVRREMITDMKMVLPSKAEQTAIATILSDMDNELTALEQKLAKARDMKQGMMQQLLTGRIRLPLEVVA